MDEAAVLVGAGGDEGDGEGAAVADDPGVKVATAVGRRVARRAGDVGRDHQRRRPRAEARLEEVRRRPAAQEGDRMDLVRVRPVPGDDVADLDIVNLAGQEGELTGA